MRILIIDDMQVRQEFYAKKYAGNDIVKAYTYDQAVEALNDGPYDIVQFDHDLGEKVAGQSGYVWKRGDPIDRTGQALVKHLLENVPEEKWPKRAIIHTMNPVAWRWMLHDLMRAGIDADYEMASVC